MKIDKLIISAAIAAILSLEAWTLKEVVALKVNVAALDARVSAIQNMPTPKIAGLK